MNFKINKRVAVAAAALLVVAGVVGGALFYGLSDTTPAVAQEEQNPFERDLGLRYIPDAEPVPFVPDAGDGRVSYDTRGVSVEDAVPADQVAPLFDGARPVYMGNPPPEPMPR